MARQITTGSLLGRITVGGNDLDRRFRAGMIVVKATRTTDPNVPIGLTQTETLELAGALLEAVKDAIND